MNTRIARQSALHLVRSFLLVVLSGLIFTTPAFAAPGDGIIEGRVLNAATGDYLMNARVVVPG